MKKTLAIGFISICVAGWMGSFFELAIQDLSKADTGANLAGVCKLIMCILSPFVGVGFYGMIKERL
jgi:ABC-type Co2+ transport system permease subunit